MKSESYCIANAILVAVFLNLVLSMLLKPFATADELKPPNGASQLSYKGQFMHMMVHHSQVPVMSSVIVGLITGVAVFLGYKLKLVNHLMAIV